MILRRFVFSVLLACAVSSCGYHLVGQGGGGGVVPSDVETVSLQGIGDNSLAWAMEFRHQMMINDARSYLLLNKDQDVPDEGLHAELRITDVSEAYTASAFDASGLATQYRLTMQARLQLLRKDTVLWDSGLISAFGEVYVLDNPTGAEASRERLGKDLRKQWVQQALARLQSGF